MLIVCPNCASRYSIDEAKLGPAGRNVRCAQCRTSFFVAPPGAASDDARADQVPAEQAGRASDTTPTRARADDATTGDGRAAEPASLMQQGDRGDDRAAGDVAADGDEGQNLARPRDQDRDQDRDPDRDRADLLPGFPPGEAADMPVVAPPASKSRSVRGPRISLPPALGALAGRLAAPLRRIPASLASVVLAVVLVGGMTTQRETIVRGIPEMAAVYRLVGLPVNLRGLELRNITSEIVREGEARVLVIEGEIVNPQDRVLSVPLLALQVAGEHREPLYEWTSEPQRPKLSPGDNLRFRARLVSPPAEGREVLVRFVSRVSETAHGQAASPPPAVPGGSAKP